MADVESAEEFIAGIDTLNAPMCATDALKWRDLAIRLEVVERLREMAAGYDCIATRDIAHEMRVVANKLESEIRKAG